MQSMDELFHALLQDVYFAEKGMSSGLRKYSRPSAKSPAARPAMRSSASSRKGRK